MFYIEKDSNSEFISIPASFWWAVVTMTTVDKVYFRQIKQVLIYDVFNKVGYGDIVPVTPSGKVIAGFTSIMGITLIALPVAIIGSKFAIIYENESLKNSLEIEYKKKRQKDKKIQPESYKHSESIAQFLKFYYKFFLLKRIAKN